MHKITQPDRLHSCIQNQTPTRRSPLSKAKKKLQHHLQCARRWQQQLMSFAHQQLFPQRCYLCHQWLHGQVYLCSSCLLTLPHISGTRCYSCQNLLLGNPASLQLAANQPRCGRCQSRPRYIERALIPFLYQTPISKMITAFKYHEDLIAGAALSSLIWQYLTKHQQMQSPIIEDLKLDHIIAVPMHPKKLKQRGFNQAHEIAKYIAKRSKLSLLAHACYKTKHHAPQSSLNYQQRLRNCNHSFAADKTQVVGRNILLIDDVYTTGSTVHAVARALKRAGAKQIVVLAVAKTEMNG